MLREDVVNSALLDTLVSTVDQDAHCVTATWKVHQTASVMQTMGSVPVSQVLLVCSVTSVSMASMASLTMDAKVRVHD